MSRTAPRAGGLHCAPAYFASRMWRLSGTFLLATLWLTACGAQPATNAPAQVAAATPDARLAQLQTELTNLAGRGDGTVGVAVTHLETGRRVAVRGAEWFPQASVRKLPVALVLLARVERGEEDLARVIELKPSDLRVGAGLLGGLWDKGQRKFTLRELLELSIIKSDNTALDATIKAAGGLAAVQQKLREWELNDIDVSRDSLQLSADYNGLPPITPADDLTPDKINRLAATTTNKQKEAAQIKMESDRRDSATPDGMNLLLGKFYRRELLKPETTALLLDIMRRTETGAGRLKGLLPPGAEVAHKTGSLARVCNDVGIITLPANKGHLAVSIFLKGSTAPEASKERILAEITRAAYNFFNQA